MSETARISRELFNAGVLFSDPAAQRSKLNELTKNESSPISEAQVTEFMDRYVNNPDQQFRDLFRTDAESISYANDSAKILNGLVSLGILSAQRPQTATDRALYAQKLNWALFVLGIANSSEVSAGLYADRFVTKFMGLDAKQPFLEPLHRHVRDFLKYRDFKKLAAIETQRSPSGFSEDVLLALGLLGFMPVPESGIIQSAALSKQFFFKEGGVFCVDFQREANALVLRHDHSRNRRIEPEQLKSFHASWRTTFEDFVPKDKLGQLPSVVIKPLMGPFPRDVDRVHIGQLQSSVNRGLNPQMSPNTARQFSFTSGFGAFGSLAALKR